MIELAADAVNALRHFGAMCAQDGAEKEWIRRLQVHVPGAPEPRLVTVDVERDASSHKPYLGAYRHKVHGATYHHATSQTPKQAPPAGPSKATREAQTIELRTRGTQSVRECSTQMARPGVLVDTSGDRELKLGEYFTACDYETCAPL